MALWVIDLFEIESDSLGEVAQGFVDRTALASDVDLKTLRHVPVLFLVYGGGQVPSVPIGLSVTPCTPFRPLCRARDVPHPALGRRPSCSVPRDGRSRTERGRLG